MFIQKEGVQVQFELVEEDNINVSKQTYYYDYEEYEDDKGRQP